ncbi:hypothetical protein B0J14DRAFT_474460 [Halenospora varia]|nr:hypothetical protein B0J14DRAFT_474460 [Halenospora varia]
MAIAPFQNSSKIPEYPRYFAGVSTLIESHSIDGKPQAQAWGLQHPRVLKSPLSCPKFLNRQQSLLLGFPPYFGTEHLTLQSSSFYERQGPTCRCIVGRSFDSFVTNETKRFIYFYLGHCAILLFKTLLRLCHPHSIHPVAHNPVFRFCNMRCIPK